MSESATSSGTAEEKKQKLMKRLKDLEERRNEARKLNHQELVEEDKRSKLPANWASRQRRLEWEEADEELRARCQETGEDVERKKLLEVSADMASRLEAKKRRKKNPDTGFADYEQASFRKYERLTKQMRPDLKSYERDKEKMGDLMYPSANTLGLTQREDDQEAIDRMSKDVESQAEKRSKYSRRRAYNDDADIDYINDRNKIFNEKLERFYGKYTTDIKQNLERGTAL